MSNILVDIIIILIVFGFIFIMFCVTLWLFSKLTVLDNMTEAQKMENYWNNCVRFKKKL